MSELKPLTKEELRLLKDAQLNLVIMIRQDAVSRGYFLDESTRLLEEALAEREHRAGLTPPN